MASAANGGGTKITEAFARGLAHGLADGVEDRNAEMLGAALAGRHAGDNFRAVLDHLLRVEAAFAAGEALHDQASVLVDQNAHRAPPARVTTFSAPSFIPSAMVKFKPESRKISWPCFDVGAFHADDDRHFELQFLCRGHDAAGQHVAAQDAAENIDEDGAHVRIADQNAECVLHLLGGSATADVEKIRRAAAG